MKTKLINLITGISTLLVPFVVASLIIGTVEYFLWNWLMPDIFGLPKITWWQGLGLYMLAHLMFSGNLHSSNDSN